MFDWLKSWFRKWFGEGTEDDWRNPFWRLTEWLRVTPEWSRYLIDIRIGFRRTRRWRSLIHFWTPTTQNFWNGIFTFNLYLTMAHIWGRRIPFLFPRFDVVIRFHRDWWFAWGVGILFDRGEFGWTGPAVFNFQGQLKHNPGCIAPGWEEGGV
jgi:hypothetical protein